MNKLKMHSPDLTQANIDKLAELFPNCLAEAAGADGVVKRSIDFDQLRQELTGSIVEGPQERYQLNWPGKREALLTANAPIAKTLRPCREESVDFDTTQNLFIEGDNLDALKLLQETYLNKVKMIYIDPPYNTGNDFIYEDDFSETSEAYKLRSNQNDSAGKRLIANTEANGRFHSDWLTMMYARLKLARNLLHDEGVIFISIDDGEVSNLRKICDEIFGHENFLADFIWKKRTGSNDSQNMVSLDHDYVVAFCKTTAAKLNGVIKDSSNYKNPDSDPLGPWARDNLTCNKTASERPNLFYPIVDPKTGIQFECNPNRVWAYEPERMARNIAEGKVIFPKPGGTPMYKRHLSELRSDRKPFSSILDTTINTVATKELRDLMGGQVFDYPKGVELLKLLIDQGGSTDDIFLDFFAGSATTAHAVMALNAEDGGHRRFVMVQLPEICDQATEAYRAGYRSIPEISKERIRRAGKKIKHDNAGKAGIDKLDVGFRVLKIDTSNMKEVFYTPDAVSQDLLSDQVNNIREDRTAEDLLFQVLLDWGVDLALPISKEAIAGKTVYFVDADANGKPALAACFDEGVSEEFVKLLALRQPMRVVFRDAGFASDSVKINVGQLFKMTSPSTEVKTI
jgi:adenine-specific DNA-methyltransferase